MRLDHVPRCKPLMRLAFSGRQRKPGDAPSRGC